MLAERTEIERRVRDEIRRSGVDPIRDSAGAHQVIEATMGAYFAESVAEDQPFGFDAESIRSHLHDSIAGFGPLQKYFDDPQVEEIWINEPGRVFVARAGRSELTTTVLTSDSVRQLVDRMLVWSGRRLDTSTPFVDAMLPDGSRLHVVIPDITRDHWAVNIRRFVHRPHHILDLVPLGTLTHQVAVFLEAAVVSGLNILVSGGTQAGKTMSGNWRHVSSPGMPQHPWPTSRGRLRTCLTTCADPSPGTAAPNSPAGATSRSPWTPNCSSATPTLLGSEAATRTPTGSSSTSPKAPTYLTSRPRT